MPHTLVLEKYSQWYQCLFHQFYKTIIRNKIWEAVRLMLNNEIQVIMLEIPKGTLMKINDADHYLTERQLLYNWKRIGLTDNFFYAILVQKLGKNDRYHRIHGS